MQLRWKSYSWLFYFNNNIFNTQMLWYTYTSIGMLYIYFTLKLFIIKLLQMWMKFYTCGKKIHSCSENAQNVRFLLHFSLFLTKPFHLPKVTPHYYRDFKPQDTTLKVQSPKSHFPQAEQTRISMCAHLSLTSTHSL